VCRCSYYRNLSWVLGLIVWGLDYGKRMRFARSLGIGLLCVILGILLDLLCSRSWIFIRELCCSVLFVWLVRAKVLRYDLWSSFACCCGLVVLVGWIGSDCLLAQQADRNPVWHGVLRLRPWTDFLVCVWFCA
jgi:hypothetical protein